MQTAAVKAAAAPNHRPGEALFGSYPFDKGSGTTVPLSAWASVTCISLLLLFPVGPQGFSLQEKKQADRAASRKGPVLRTTGSAGGTQTNKINRQYTR